MKKLFFVIATIIIVAFLTVTLISSSHNDTQVRLNLPQPSPITP